MNYLRRLKTLEAPITTAIIGMGAMGKGLLYQTTVTPNVKCVAIADLDLAKTVQCAETFNINSLPTFSTANGCHSCVLPTSFKCPLI